MARVKGATKGAVLVYDAGCGACSRFKGLVSFFDAAGNIGYVPLVDADREGLLDAVPESLRFLSMHFVGSDMSVRSGSEAVPGILQMLPLGSIPSAFLGRTGIGRRLAKIAYGSASRLRSRSCRARAST